MTDFDNDQPGVPDDERAKRQQIKQSRSIQGMEKRWRNQDHEELDQWVAANAPPVIVEPRCHVCQHPNRLWMERQLIRGVAYSTIANSIPNGPDRRSIANHYKQHMNLEGALTRALMEEEADLLQQNYEEGVKGAFSTKAALGVMIRKGFSDVLDNITVVEPKDMVKMMEMYEKMDASSATQMVEEARAAVNIFMEAIRNVFSDNLDKDKAEALSQAIVLEVKRLREQNELEAKIENHMRQIPSVGKSGSN